MGNLIIGLLLFFSYLALMIFVFGVCIFLEVLLETLRMPKGENQN